MRRLRYILALCVVLSATIVFAQQQELQLANHYFNNGEYDKSAEIYEQLFTKNPDDFNYHRLTECLIRQKQYSEAEKVVKKRLKQRPDDASIYVDWGWIAENNGKRKQAEKHYSTAIEKAGYNKSIIDKVAEAFENIGHPQQAIQTYQSAGERLRNPYAYCVKSLKNNCIDVLRRRQRMTQITNLDNLMSEPLHDLAAEVWKAKEKLPRNVRALVELHDIDGYSTSELAVLTGVSNSTVKRLIAKAHNQIRNELTN